MRYGGRTVAMVTARARAGYGARRWARGRPGRASAGDFWICCVAAPPERRGALTLRSPRSGAVSQANERTDGLKARGKWSHSDSRSLPWQGNASGNPPGSADSHKPWTLDKNKLTALFKTELPFRVQAHRTRAVDKAELASVIQDAATASSSIIDETMAMLNEQDTLDNVKAKLKPFNVDERIQNLPKVVRKLCKVCGPGNI